MNKQLSHIKKKIISSRLLSVMVFLSIKITLMIITQAMFIDINLDQHLKKYDGL